MRVGSKHKHTCRFSHKIAVKISSTLTYAFVICIGGENLAIGRVNYQEGIPGTLPHVQQTLLSRYRQNAHWFPHLYVVTSIQTQEIWKLIQRLKGLSRYSRETFTTVWNCLCSNSRQKGKSNICIYLYIYNKLYVENCASNRKKKFCSDDGSHFTLLHWARNNLTSRRRGSWDALFRMGCQEIACESRLSQHLHHCMN